MNPRASFFRKIGYLAAIGVLLMPLFWLSHPGTGEVRGTKGVLVQLRDDYGLSQTQLGQIDPTAETVKLASLGMRGIAADILWTKANNYQMKKDWTSLRATLEQISKVQPHFIAVWRHQAWNLSYNVSVSFDDYHDKYYWVIEGIKFLQQGAKYNDREPRLLWDLGWFIAQKVGRDDAAKQYRRLFRQDEDFQKVALPPIAEITCDDSRDNWLVGKAWFRAAEYLVDTWHVPVKGKSQLMMFSDAPMCQMYYADNLEKEGRFGEAAQAWKKAAGDWQQYGNREFDTTWGVRIHLNDLRMHEDAAARIAAELDALAPGVRQHIIDKKLADLAPDERKALATPSEKRTSQQHALAAEAEPRVEVSHDEVAQRVTGRDRDKARRLARDAIRQEELASYVRRERSHVNFGYWEVRAEAEQTDDMLAARNAIYRGRLAVADNRPLDAKKYYNEGFKAWRKVLDRFKLLREDPRTGEDLMNEIRFYQRMILDQFDEKLPEPFILQDIIDKHGKKEE